MSGDVGRSGATMEGAAGMSAAPSALGPLFGMHIVKRPHFGRWLAALVIGAIVVGLAYAVATTPNIAWPQVGSFFANPAVLSGLEVTLELTVLAMVIGIVLGIVLALMRLSSNVVLRVSSLIYIWLFRGSPLLVQIIVWYNIALGFSLRRLFWASGEYEFVSDSLHRCSFGVGA